MKQLFLVYIALLFAFMAKAQKEQLVRYYNYASKARFCYYSGNHQQALELLDTAFSLKGIKGHIIDQYCIALCHLKMGDTDRALLTLKQCLQDSTVSLELLIDQTSIGVGHGFKIAPGETRTFRILNFHFINDHPVLESEFQALIDKVRIFPRRASTLKDSAYYYWINDGWQYNVSLRPVISQHAGMYRWLDTARFNTHEQVQDALLSFLEENGYPGFYNSASEVLLPAICHLSPERKRKAIPVIENAFQQQNLSPVSYGFFLEKCVQDTLGMSSCSKYAIMGTDCPVNNWSAVIGNRKSLGISLYLDFDDYAFQAFSIQRNVLPWVARPNQTNRNVLIK